MNDEQYMKLAISLGEAAAGQTGRNPSVGCVIVKDGRIVGMGAHLKQGEAHAEVHALNMAGAEAAGGTAYVTLEPCSHHGKTPPCADRLIRERVQRVVVGAKDPNPLVAGRGIARLRENGIEVSVGVLREEAERLHEPFFRSVANERPYVAAKAAMTLDGRVAAPTGDSKWITNAASRAFAHELRHRHQAILVGVGTVIADDPRLTARTGDGPTREPTRVIVDSRLRTPPESAALAPRADGAPPALVLTTETAPAAARAALAARGAVVIDCGPGPRVDLLLALGELYRLGIGTVLAEGGGTIVGALLAERLVDMLYAFVAPKIIGVGGPSGFELPGAARMQDAIALERLTIRQFEGDVLFAGIPVYPKETR